MQPTQPVRPVPGPIKPPTPAPPVHGGPFRVMHYGGSSWGIFCGYYSDKVHAECKKTPGLHWTAQRKAWCGYKDAVEAAAYRMRSVGIRLDTYALEDNGLTSVANAKMRPILVPALATRDLRDYQGIGVEFLVTHSPEGVILADDVGLGKAQPLDARVLTPDGWRLIGDLNVGDPVIDPDGGVAHVSGVYPRGQREVFRVTMKDGGSTECCAEHLWLVQTPNDRCRDGERVENLATIASNLTELRNNGNRCSHYFIPITQPIERLERELPLDPYLLGVLLGDGGLSIKHRVLLTTADAEIVARVRQRLPREARIVGTAQRLTWRIAGRNHHDNPVLTALRGLELTGKRSWEKSIPQTYMAGSAAQRLELLRGLMDTDGTCSVSRRVDSATCTFTSTSERLAEQVIDLTRSLGGVASTYSRVTRYTHKGVEREGRRSWTINVRLPANPFWLTRKALLWQPPNLARAIASIESAGVKPTRCIAVDSKRHLYVTDDYIVTHNTVQAIRAARALRGKTIIVVPNFLKSVWVTAILGDKTLTPPTPVGWPGAKFEVLGKTKPWDIAPDTKIVIINYDVLHAWADTLIAWQPSTIIFDECFPAGTQVETATGPRPIETIGIGTEVLTATGRGYVRAARRRVVHIEETRLVTLDDGRAFIATSNHPCLTNRGWITAGTLRAGDALIDGATTRTLCSKQYHVSDNSREGVSPMAREAARETTVPAVSRDALDPSAEGMLLDLLRAEEELGRPGVPTTPDEGTSQPADAFGHHETAATRAQAQPVVGDRGTASHEDVQPHADPRGAGQGAREPTGSWGLATAQAGRQRQTEAAAGAEAGGSSRTAVAPVPRRDWHRPHDQQTAVLRDRPRTPAGDDRCGDRRPEPLQQQDSGPAQGSLPPLARVARVQIPQQEDYARLGLGGPNAQGGVEVFNLEVSGHPSYTILGGLVVHNCHYLMGEKARRTRSAARIAAACANRVGLSATPMTSRPRDLWAPVNVISPGRLGENPWPYYKLHCNAFTETVQTKTQDRLVWNTKGSSNLDELQKRLPHFMLRRNKTDVALQIPPKTRQIVEVDVDKRFVLAISVALQSDDSLRRALEMASDGKLGDVAQLAINHVESGHSVIIGCWRKAVAEALADGIRGAGVKEVGVIHSEINDKKRKALIASKPKVTCITYGTSVGIDLSYADVGIGAELTHVPSELLQWEGRFARFRQTRNVLVQYIIARGTADELIRDGVLKKLHVLEGSLGKSDSKLREDLAGVEKSPAEQLKTLYDRIVAKQQQQLELEDVE